MHAGPPDVALHAVLASKGVVAQSVGMQQHACDALAAAGQRAGLQQQL